jgi:CRP-like cAMP-binding protein
MSRVSSIPDCLKETGIFTGLDNRQLAQIAAISLEREYEAGDVIFDEGSESDELYIVASGEVDIVLIHQQGSAHPSHEPLILTTLRRCDSFGEIALVDQGIRSASAISGRPETLVILIPRQKLRELCNQDPALGYRIMSNLAAGLASTLRARTLDIQSRDWLLWARGRAMT